MTMKNGRSTLDCLLVDGTLRSSGGAQRRDKLHSYSAKVELDMSLLHRRLCHSGNDAIQKLLWTYKIHTKLVEVYPPPITYPADW